MDRSMRMVIIAGLLMLALLVAVIGSVGADAVSWRFAGQVIYPPGAQAL